MHMVPLDDELPLWVLRAAGAKQEGTTALPLIYALNLPGHARVLVRVAAVIDVQMQVGLAGELRLVDCDEETVPGWFTSIKGLNNSVLRLIVGQGLL